MLTTADRLRDTLKQLSDKRGELAEVLKAEAQAKVEAYSASQDPAIRGREKEADALALPHTLDIIDLKVDIQILESWERFYTLILTHNLDVSLIGCPPDRS